MAKTELKTIPVNKILANFTQPREHFDKEKTKELAESILSNGLINPITIRKYKGDKYMIVSGERRWQAHKVAGLKNILAFIKKYKDEGQMMIESLIENVHREDLEDMEKAKFLEKIAKIKNLYYTETKGFYKKGDIDCAKLSKLIGLSRQHILRLINLREPRFFNISKAVEKKEISEAHFRNIKRIEDKKTQERVLEKVKREELSSPKTEKLVRTIKKAPEEIKKSLLSDEITTKQAEDISRIHSPKAREQALEQVKQHRQIAERHEHIADITPELMERAKPEISDDLRRRFRTINRKIFEDLNDIKVSLIKSNRNLKKANSMLNELTSESFEYALDKKTLLISLQQIKRISDTIENFNIEVNQFDDLKKIFVERIEDKLGEEK